MEQTTLLKEIIRDIPDYPKEGILFKDITPLLADAKAFSLSIDLLVEQVAPYKPTKVVGLDARGFIFGAAVAKQLGCGFIPIRKKGKLPWKTHGVEYELEYGSNSFEMHQDAIEEGESVVIVDDLLATGGTAEAAQKLIAKCGGNLTAYAFLVELSFLNGTEKLNAPVHSILQYD